MEDKYLNGAGIITLYYKLCEKFFPQTGSYIKKLEDGTTKTVYPSLTIGSTSTNSELKIYGTTTSTGTITASKFIRSDKSTGFLKGDGNVDTNSYALSSHTHSYLPLGGGTLTGSLTIGSTSANKNLNVYGAATTTGTITASKFVRSDKSTGFLKGDGSVDTNSYAKSTHTHSLTDIKGTVVTNVYTTDGILCVSKLANNQGSSDTLDNLHSATADKLYTPRTISLTGGVSGSGNFDGSSNITISTTLQSHTHSYLPLSGGTLTGALTIGSTSANKDLNLYGSFGCYGSTTNNRIHFYTATADNSSLGLVNGNKYIQVVDVTNSKYTTITPSQITSTNIDLNGTIKSTGFVHKGANDKDNIVLTNGSHVAKSDIVVGSANKLSTSRTISLTGSVTGSGTFNGSSDLTITTTTNHDHTFASLTSKPNILTSLSINPSTYRLQYTKYSNGTTQTSLVAPDGSTTKYCSDFLECPIDKRATAETPQDYVKGLHVQFKDTSTLNTNKDDTIGKDGSYAGVITLRPFGTSNNVSGGVAQLAMTTGNNLWFRTKASATTWNDWKNYATTADTVYAAERVYQYNYTNSFKSLKYPLLTSYVQIGNSLGYVAGVIGNTDLYAYKGSIICKNSSITADDADYSSRLITYGEMVNYVKAQMGGFIPSPISDEEDTPSASTMSLRAAAVPTVSEEVLSTSSTISEEKPRIVLYKKNSNRKDKSYALRLEGAQWWINNGYVPVFFRKAKKHNKSHSNPGFRRVGYVWCDIDSNSNLIIYPDKSYYDFCGLNLVESIGSFTKDLNLGHLLCPSKITGEYRKIRWGSNSPLYEQGKKLEFKFKLGFVPRSLFTSEGLIDGSYDHTKVRTNFYQIGIEDVKSNLIDIMITASGTSNETWFNQRSVDVVGF